MNEINLAEIEFETCAEELMYLLFAHGIEYLFLNPGTDSAPLQEAAASLNARNVPIPRIITCSFESVALAAAHGYWRRTGKPQAVFVHVDVGTQNLGAMLHNVFRDKAGVVLLAGRTPYSEDPTSAGSRSSSIHWQQDIADQAGIVRGYAKWTYELVRSSDTSRVIGRAIQIAAGDIAGLAYLMLSRDVLMDPPGKGDARRIHGFALPEPPAMSTKSLSRVVELLQGANRPVIISGRIGWGLEGSNALEELAELYAIPVVERGLGTNIPTSHPMSVRDDTKAKTLIAQADLLIIIECDVPWIPSKTSISQDATIIQIDRDPVKAAMPLWSFPVDLAITSDGAEAVRQLADALKARHHRVNPGLVDKGSIATTNGAEKLRTGRVSRREIERELGVQEVVTTLNALLRPEDLVVLEAVSNNPHLLRYLERVEAGTLCSSGGPGLGWALGASVGIKLAEPARRVIAIMGDGAFLFGVPTSALCLAAEAQTPFLVIVLNNNGYRASRLPVYELFPDGASARMKDVIGTRFAHPPDFVAVAEACGAYGKRVTRTEHLLPRLQTAFDVVENGRVAVIDIGITNGEV